jgi:hypothetical protein
LHRLKDNPTPYEFPVSIIGAKPQVAVKLDAAPASDNGISAAAAAAAESAAGTGEATTNTTTERRHTSQNGGVGSAAAAAKPNAGKPVPGKAPAAKAAADYTIQFERLLLGRKDTQTFTLSNPGVLPFKWRLAGASQLPPEFRVTPSEGELAARSKVQVAAEFSALKKLELSELLTLEVRLLLPCLMHARAARHAACRPCCMCSQGHAHHAMHTAGLQVLDVGEALGVSRAIPIAIRGEAYHIHVDLKFPQEGFPGIDFGPLRVADDCVKALCVRNTEKYDARFAFAIAGEEVRQLVTITPEAGVVPPGKEVAISVRVVAGVVRGVRGRGALAATDTSQARALTALLTGWRPRCSTLPHRCTGTRA